MLSVNVRGDVSRALSCSLIERSLMPNVAFGWSTRRYGYPAMIAAASNTPFGMYPISFSAMCFRPYLVWFRLIVLIGRVSAAIRP